MNPSSRAISHFLRIFRYALMLPFLLITLGASTTQQAPTADAASPLQGRQVVGYFEQWGIYSNYFARNIVAAGSAGKLTVLNYAFGNVSTDLKCYIENRAGWGDAWADFQRPYAANESVSGKADSANQPLKGNFNQLRQLKAQFPHLKNVISLGGWTWSGRFSDAALPQNRVAFVKSCIDLYIKGNMPVLADDPTSGGKGVATGVFDGIDIDWEFPAAPGFEGDPSVGLPPNKFRPEDTQNYTALLREFRHQLDELGEKTGKHYLLTAAIPAGPEDYSKIELHKISNTLSWLNMMSYDYHGNWEVNGPTNFVAPLYSSPNDPSDGQLSIDKTVKDFLKAGVPARKIVMGIPFYGYGWSKVPAKDFGLYQGGPQVGLAPGAEGDGTSNYNEIIALKGFAPYRDPITHAFWIFDGSTFWTYDDPQEIADKMDYVEHHGLGGAMIWPLRGDDSSGTLVQTIFNGLH